MEWRRGKWSEQMLLIAVVASPNYVGSPSEGSQQCSFQHAEIQNYRIVDNANFVMGLWIPQKRLRRTHLFCLFSRISFQLYEDDHSSEREVSKNGKSREIKKSTEISVRAVGAWDGQGQGSKKTYVPSSSSSNVISHENGSISEGLDRRSIFVHSAFATVLEFHRTACASSFMHSLFKEDGTLRPRKLRLVARNRAVLISSRIFYFGLWMTVDMGWEDMDCPLPSISLVFREVMD